MPVIGALMQFPAAWWIERFGDRRRVAVVGSLGRQIWLVPALLLLIPFAPSARLTIFLLATAIGQVLIATSTNAWSHWMTDLIPPSVRGRYFGARGAFMGFAAMIAGYGGAALIDRGAAGGWEAYAYVALLVVGAICGALGSYLLTKQPEPSMSQHQQRTMRELLMTPLQHRRFRAFAGTFVIWQVGLGAAAPFFTAYGLTTLALPLRTLALMDTVTALTSLIAQPQWGKLADRIGQRKVLLICMFGVVPLPWFWLAATPTRVWPLFVNSAMAGIMWAGMLMAQTNRLMEQAPADGRSAYFAAFSVATGVPYMLASLGAGLVVTITGVEPIMVAGTSFHPYLGFFILSSVLRLIATVLGRKAL
jgi:MFS family permease